MWSTQRFGVRLVSIEMVLADFFCRIERLYGLHVLLRVLQGISPFCAGSIKGKVPRIGRYGRFEAGGDSDPVGAQVRPTAYSLGR